MKNEKCVERISFLVTENRKKELQDFADKCGYTLSGLIKAALVEYMKNNK